MELQRNECYKIIQKSENGPKRSTAMSSKNPVGFVPDNHQKVRNMLLAIWATDKNNCDQSRCSLARCITNIDRRLKEGLITFESKGGKKRAQNPGVVKAPNVIKNYLGVQNLTTEQNDVFHSNENLLWINGPAGAGKTVILSGKMIQLIQSNEENKVVLFGVTGKGNNSFIYQHALVKAGVKYEEIMTDKDNHTTAEVSYLISQSVCRVVIVMITGYLNITQFTCMVSLVRGFNLLIDDIQRVLYYSTAEECDVLMKTLRDLSEDCNVWIACDMVQASGFVDTRDIMNLAMVISEKLQVNQKTALSMNLRNTFDISNILSVIRNRFIKLCSSRMDIVDMILPLQKPGHFIHGPKAVLHVLDKFNVEIIGMILNEELDKLKGLYNSNIGIINNSL